MKTLVTGATGFVGGALGRRLLERGDRLCALVRDGEKARGLRDAGAEIFLGSIADPNQVAEAAAGCEVVFHCAGEGSHHASACALRWINIAGTENVINAARHAGCRRVVYLSCADATLLDCDRMNWKEDRTLIRPPLDACSRSKMLAEELALLASCRGTEVTALRPAWIWGPGDHTALPGLCQEAEKGGIRLFGRGGNLLATVYIDNLVDALLSASQAAGAARNAYYVTDGEFLEAREFFGMLSRSLGLPPPRPGWLLWAYAEGWIRERLKLPGPWRADVVLRGRSSLFDTLRAIQELDYHPKVTVEQGMSRLAEWAKKVGGPRAIAAMLRRPADDHSVEAQIEAARAAVEGR